MKPRPSSDIPLARERLLAIADALPDPVAGEIREVVRELMVRVHSDVQRGRTRRGSLYPALASAIRAYKLADPEALQDDIAAHFGVGGGRVSEALAGHNYSPRGTGQKK